MPFVGPYKGKPYNSAIFVCLSVCEFPFSPSVVSTRVHTQTRMHQQNTTKHSSLVLEIITGNLVGQALVFVTVVLRRSVTDWTILHRCHLLTFTSSLDSGIHPPSHNTSPLGLTTRFELTRMACVHVPILTPTRGPRHVHLDDGKSHL